MHYWGDEWFIKHGNELSDAIGEIERELRKCHIGIYGKEKYGTYRDEYLRFWDGSLYQILFGYRACIGTYRTKGLYKYEWFTNIIDDIHKFIAYKIPRFPKWLRKLVNDHQAKMYNKVFQMVCKKYPNIVDELIMCVDGYDMIKPCKWGNIDGKEIHNRYWRTI